MAIRITEEDKKVIEQHPYWATLEGTLLDLRKHISLLEKRIEFLQSNMSSKTPFEANEAEILILATKPEIASKKATYNERLNYNYKFMLDFMPLYDDCIKNFDATLQKAEQKRKYNREINELLNSVNWEFMNKELEAKCKLYERLKKLL